MRKAFSLPALLLLFITTAFSQVKVVNLLTENLTDPIGIDVKQPRFSWQLSGSQRGLVQIAYELRVLNGKKTVWTSGKQVSDQSVHVPYGGGELLPGEKYSWQVRVWDNSNKASSWSTASFQMGLATTDWKAKWIEAGFDEDLVNRPAQYFRKPFRVGKKLKSATVFISAHGIYEAAINGKRVGDHYLSPGWTSYNKRLQYQAFDVTDLITTGNNAIGVAVGNGWYRSNLAWENRKNIYGDKLGVLLQLQIKYTDGSSELIVSDDSWKSSTGAVRYTEIYHGETKDARAEKKGWLMAGYDDSGWAGVKQRDYPLDNLVATYNEPIKKHETFKPVKIFKTPKGEQVIDFGQNLVGWVTVKLRGNAGDSIIIQHAEVLDKEGNFYLDNLRGAKAKAIYYLKGGQEEVFEPSFTFFGFRYIKISGFTASINEDNFTAVALYSAMKPTGSFISSHPLINQLQHNIQWGQRGNFLDVPTDCPQRDERLGWTGDAQAFSRTAAFNFGVNNFFAKWLKDLAADQINGSVPFVIPNVLNENSAGSAGWADAATIIPWDMYLAYGDRKVLEDQYESMKAWVGYMERNSVDNLWNKGFHFGDWLFYRPFDDNDGRSAVTDKYLIAQCFFAHSTELIVKAAKVLGRAEDVIKYQALLKNIKDAFLKEYVTPSGRLVSGTQTAYVLALHFDMLPESMRAKAAETLANNIKSYNNHLTTGFLGTPYLCHVLSRFGYTDLAYTLLLQESYPSWLYPVKMGATTIWERWDGIKPDSSFQTPGMNSFNHYAYGAIGDWMYRVVAGLETDEEKTGYKKIIIRPHVSEKLGHAAATLQTYYGKLHSGWKLDNGILIIDIIIPANTKATVFIPATDVSLISESGQQISNRRDINVAGSENGSVKLQLGSGSYEFTVNQ